MVDHTKSNHKYLVIKAKGGMGNRMLCAVTGMVYGELTGRRTVVDWRDGTYSDDGSNVFARFFSCPNVFSESILPPEGTVRPSIWADKLDWSVASMIEQYDPDKHSSILIHRKYSVDVRGIDYDEDILVFWYYTQRMRALRGHLRHGESQFVGLSDKQVIRKVLLERMRLHDDIQQRMADFKARYWQHPVIGVHIRHTDLRTNLAQYERYLRRVLERVPDACIFLATDNRQVNEDYRKQFKNVISTQKWFPDEVSSMHQNPSCSDRLANGIEALVDMYLLADCDYLIYAGASTFSWVARLLSSLPPNRVIDIERFSPTVRLKRLIRELIA
jgi:hypothetical protein